ncbi:unnamed protein product [Sphagnum balticum]
MKTKLLTTSFVAAAALFSTGLLVLDVNASASAGRAFSQQIDAEAVKPTPLISTSHDGKKVLQDVITRVAQLGAYKFEGLLGTVKDRSMKIDAGSFYYMPKCLRVEVKSGGFKAGAIVVKRKDGVIRAKGGPALFGMKVNLQPDSNMLKLPNGLNIVECDYLSLLKWLQSEIASGQKVYASEAPMNVPNQAQNVLVLETREAGGADGIVAHRVIIDPKLLVPIEWDIFRQGKFVSTVRFNDFQLCPTMDESFFQL